MARDMVLNPGETCPPGYITYHYLGDAHERCRPLARYLLMPLDTSPERRVAWGGMDGPRLSQAFKDRADDASRRARREGTSPWGLYDRQRNRFAYKGDAAAAIRRQISLQEKSIANQQRALLGLQDELIEAERDNA